MRMTSFFNKAFSIIVIFSLLCIPKVPYVKASENTASTKCGTWMVQTMGPIEDFRYIVSLEDEDKDTCQALLTFSNIGTYSLQFKTIQRNASIEFKEDPKKLLIPELDIDVIVTPVYIKSQSSVQFFGEITLDAYSMDIAFFLLKTGFSLLEVPCLISTDKLMLIAQRLYPLLSDMSRSLSSGDISGAMEEWDRVKITFYEKAADYAIDAGISCATKPLEELMDDFLSELLKEVSIKGIKIASAFISWWGLEMYDLLDFKKGNIYVQLTYIPPTPPTSTPSPTPIPPLVFEGLVSSYEDLNPLCFWCEGNCLDMIIKGEIQIINGTDISGFLFSATPGNSLPLSGTVDSIFGEMLIEEFIITFRAKIEDMSIIGTWEISDPRITRCQATVRYFFDLPLK